VPHLDIPRALVALAGALALPVGVGMTDARPAAAASVSPTKAEARIGGSTGTGIYPQGWTR
jgi:hypothetical protein